MNRHALLLLVAVVPVHALDRQEFAEGLELQLQGARPLQELILPDAIYAGVVRPDLGDLRVFNDDRAAVPHALCEADAPLAWFDAQRLPLSNPGTGFLFNAGRLAPVTAARVTPPAPNLALDVSLQSRPSIEVPWRSVWAGAAGAAAAFDANADRFWRVQVTQGGQSLAGRAPALQLGRAPQLLRFVVQGRAPFLLAYGSSVAERAPARGCDALSELLSDRDRRAPVGTAQVGAKRTLGGENVRKRPTDQPAALMLLWVALAIGSAMLLGMAFSYLRKVRER